MSMTQKKFFDLLAKTKRQYHWSVNNYLDGEIRATARNKTATLEYVDGTFCPITAVARFCRKGVYDADAYAKAAEALNLDLDFAEKVVDAADYETTVNKRVRKNLEKSLGLK